MSGLYFKIFMRDFHKMDPNQTMIMDNICSYHVGWTEEEEKPNTNIVYLSPYFNIEERMFQEIKKPLKGIISNFCPSDSTSHHSRHLGY